MKKIVFYLITISWLNIFSQKNTTKEFSLKTDNDLYSSISKDGYYTSGLFLSYRFIDKKKRKKTIKKIHELEIAQKLYSPYNSNVKRKSQHDRPFAGYLYASYGFFNHYKKNNILIFNTQIGIVGPDALGKETMSFVHDIYNFERPHGWRYQVSNTLGLNFKIKHIKNIKQLSFNRISTDWASSVNTGTIFNNLSIGINLRLGIKPLKNTNNTLLYKGNLYNTIKNNKELFIIVSPKIRYQLYDTTIKGSLFNNTSSITYDVKPFVFQSTFGIAYAIKKLNISYKVTFHSRKLQNDAVANINRYGSIELNYLFK